MKLKYGIIYFVLLCILQILNNLKFMAPMSTLFCVRTIFLYWTNIILYGPYKSGLP